MAAAHVTTESRPGESTADMLFAVLVWRDCTARRPGVLLGTQTSGSGIEAIRRRSLMIYLCVLLLEELPSQLLDRVAMAT